MKNCKEKSKRRYNQQQHAGNNGNRELSKICEEGKKGTSPTP